MRKLKVFNTVNLSCRLIPCFVRTAWILCHKIGAHPPIFPHGHCDNWCFAKGKKRSKCSHKKSCFCFSSSILRYIHVLMQNRKQKYLFWPLQAAGMLTASAGSRVQQQGAAVRVSTRRTESGYDEASAEGSQVLTTKYSIVWKKQSIYQKKDVHLCDDTHFWRYRWVPELSEQTIPSI